MNSKILLGLVLVAATAATVSYYAMATLRMNPAVEDVVTSSQLRPAIGQTNADFIRQNYPWHLISPTWIHQGDLSAMLRRWLKMERAARLGVVACLWLSVSGLILWRQRRNREKT